MVTAAAAQTLADIQRPLMLIDGKRVGSAGGRTLTVENPAKRKPIAEVPRAAAADVDARRQRPRPAAFARWNKVVPRERGKLLLKIADAIEARVEEIARTIAHGDRQRAAHPGARRGQARGRHLPLFRRARQRAERRDRAARRARPELHAPRADRRRRRDHPLERAGACWARSRSRRRCAPATRWC